MLMSTSIKLDESLKTRVRHLADSRQCTPHWIMREAVAQYVEREEARESFLQEALASWKSYQESGLHLTEQEIRDWLETWGTENETEAPLCHK